MVKQWLRYLVRFLAEWGVGELLSYLISWKAVLSAIVTLLTIYGTILSRLPWPVTVVIGIAGFAFTLFLINEAISFYTWLSKSNATPPIAERKHKLEIRFMERHRPYFQAFENHQVHLSTGTLYYGRVGIYNDGDKTIDDVSVKLRQIMPDPVGRHDLPLHFMHDNDKPYKQAVSIAPKQEVLVDVVSYFDAFMHDNHIDVQHTVPNALPNLAKLPLRDYTAKIWASGRNVETVRQQFKIGVEDKKLYMKLDVG